MYNALCFHGKSGIFKCRKAFLRHQKTLNGFKYFSKRKPTVGFSVAVDVSLQYRSPVVNNSHIWTINRKQFCWPNGGTDETRLRQMDFAIPDNLSISRDVTPYSILSKNLVDYVMTKLFHKILRWSVEILFLLCRFRMAPFPELNQHCS